MKIILLIVLLASSYGARIHPIKSTKLGKIIGGHDISAKEVPYQLQLEVEGWQICGATIINSFLAVTSASCVDGYTPRQLTLRAGTDRKEDGGRIQQVYRINSHPKYDDFFKDFDIAILEVATPFREDDNTQVVDIAAQEPTAGTMVRVTGYGRRTEEGSSSNQLQAVDIPIFPRTNCTLAYAGDITNRMICAGVKGQDACSGDTGGPLVNTNTEELVGIVSWSYGCAQDGFPGVYTNIADPDIQAFIASFVG